jgi:hypothetical protein
VSRPGLLVTGAPRSGTTFVGRMLALPASVGYLDEPFNVQIGMTWVPRQFVAAGPDDDAPGLDRAVEDLLAGRAVLRQTPFHTGTGPLARAGRAVLGSRAQLRYQLARRDPRVRRWLLKDPIACFVAERLHVRHGMPVVVVVRHPAAVVASFLRLGWRFDLDGVPRVPAVAGLDPDDPVVEGARLWTACYAELAEVADRRPDVLVVRHEDLCRAPVEGFRALYDALDLPWSPGTASTVVAHTAAENPVRVGVAHELRRDSASLATAWQEGLATDAVERVRQVTGPLAARWYADEEW